MSVAVDRSLRYGDERIAFSVRVQPARKAQRIAIHVEPDGRVVVDVPAGKAGAKTKAEAKAEARAAVKARETTPAGEGPGAPAK